MIIKPLPRSFYQKPTLDVAKNLIGKNIALDKGSHTLTARIVEVEAYISVNDPACHAARGKTKRNELMFGEPGYVYVYFIYGMYHCLNFVTEKKGTAAAVLLRAAEPLDNREKLDTANGKNFDERLLAGPGKFCRAFQIDKRHNGLDLTNSEIYLYKDNEKKPEIVTTTRIGITKGEELLYRFYDKNSKAVSKR